MKKIGLLIVMMTLASNIAVACYQYKQCCRRTLQGTQCIQTCSYEMCPLMYPIEIK